jgi:hypothetical protein
MARFLTGASRTAVPLCETLTIEFDFGDYDLVFSEIA